MPIIFPKSPPDQSAAAATPAVNPAAARSTPLPAPPAMASMHSFTPPSGSGFSKPPPGDDGDGGPKRERRRREDFSNLTAGWHDYVCAVDSILDFGGGRVTLNWTVVAGPERDRELNWDQYAPPYCHPPAAKHVQSMSIWFGSMVACYTGCGMPYDSWLADGGTTMSGDPTRVPPYYAFFVHEAADGVHVPILFDVRVQVDSGHEKYAKIRGLAPHLIDGKPVQAPMPRRVMPGIEKAHHWTGLSESFNTVNGPVSYVKLDWKQLGLGHGGLKTYKDVR